MLCLYSLWKSLSLSNSTYNITFSFFFMANLLLRLLTSKFKFPIFKFTIAMVWNNLATLFACITFVTTLSIDFGVLVYVVGFLDPFTKGPNSCINILPSPSSNECPPTNPTLLIGTCSSSGLNTTIGVCVPILSIYNLVACIPPCVYCCCCYCFYFYCCKCCYKC